MDVAVAAMLAPLVVAVVNLEVEVLVLGFEISLKGMPEKVHYRTLVASHLEATRTPVLVGRAQKVGI